MEDVRTPHALHIRRRVVSHHVEALRSDGCSTGRRLVRLPEAITELSNAIPVRAELEQAVSAAIRTDVEAGRYVELETEARQNYSYALCPETLQRASR